MYTAGTITITGVQRPEPIHRLFTIFTQDVKNLLVQSYISDYVVTTPASVEQQVGGTLALIELANHAKRNKWKGPTDLAINHNKYFSVAWNEESASKKRSKE